MALRGQWLPPEIFAHRNKLISDTVSPSCASLRDKKIKVALSNSFGFGGANAFAHLPEGGHEPMDFLVLHGAGAGFSGGLERRGNVAESRAQKEGEPLPCQDIQRPGWDKPLAVHLVPAPPTSSNAFLASPAAAGRGEHAPHGWLGTLEALGNDAVRVQSGELRLGIIVCMMAGGVTYSRRFFEEVMKAPEMASPLIFPETVFNAPASHVGAYLGSKTINYTLVGDNGTFLQGLALGAGWLESGRTDACVVIGTEEVDWVVADALRIVSARHNLWCWRRRGVFEERCFHCRTDGGATDSLFSPATSDCASAGQRQVRAAITISGSAEGIIV